MLQRLLIVSVTVVVMLALGCGQQEETKTPTAEVKSSSGAKSKLGFELLSEYGLFTGTLAELNPAEGVIPYELNTPLFTDYAHKKRFVKVPAGEQVKYTVNDALEFPVGTILIKNFYYPKDFNDLSQGRKIMETRLLIHKEDGWEALPYIWNDEQTDATLEIAGGTRKVSWVHYDGNMHVLDYAIPNKNQCKGCHVRGKEMTPIGPKARNLNGNYKYTDGEMNQLLKWQELGMLEGLPDIAEVDEMPVWDDTHADLYKRGRAYLDVNCAHCHRTDGPGNTSGLFLTYEETDNGKLGYSKAPVAAGRGSGGRLYDLVPGQPDSSILYFRMNSTDPGIMMPELGRKTNHEEGLMLIQAWIESLDDNNS